MKVKKCPACSGSGYYDSFGSPVCSACNGLGVARGKLNVY
jgi:DnaJ-class molecular chaperone